MRASSIRRRGVARSGPAMDSPSRMASWTFIRARLYTSLPQDGKVTPAWQKLFATYPERFAIGSDTWVNQRWAQYGEIMAWYRGWLAQLPDGTARRIAFTNAAGLFKGASGK